MERWAGKAIKSVFILTEGGGDNRVDRCPRRNGTKLSVDLEGRAIRAVWARRVRDGEGGRQRDRV